MSSRDFHRVPYGHISNRGFWHPGRSERCRSCSEPRKIVIRPGSRRWTHSQWIALDRWLLRNFIDLRQVRQVELIIQQPPVLEATMLDGTIIRKPVRVAYPGWLWPTIPPTERTRSAE